MRSVRELIREVAATLFGTVAVVLAAIIGLWLLAGLIIPWFYWGSEPRRGKQNRAQELAASAKNAAVVIRPNDRETQILLIDFATGIQTRLGSRQYDLSTPYLSPDGQRILLVRRPVGTIEESELLSCDTAGLTSKNVLKNKGSIHSQVELPGGRILYV